MSKPITEVSKTLQSAYDEQYTDQMTEWREHCGKYKAANILNVCRNISVSKVLECGAGEGSILKWLDTSDAFSELYAVEISDTGVKQIEKRQLNKLREVRKFNGYEIPFSDKEFDMTYCSHVIEHVEHPRLLLREIKRVSNFQVFEIPLDYSAKVDEQVKELLSVGHVNVYTPSLFRFLLKSEGYDIIDEVLTHADKETVRFNWYKNLKIEKTFSTELRLHLRDFRNRLRRLRCGNNRYVENGFNAYTCLAKGVGELRIF
jgi:ubiquinone/menaquinone biosynthesis C-methylase UbiE